MSQQTTLAVVLPKFAEFIQQLPTVNDLASCDEEKLRQLWAGLGYYARARNLKKGAEFIVGHLNGRFPQSYREWLQIPGCGDYTAAAIASICFNERVPCIDGNVVRVVSRLLALQDAWSAAGRSRILNYLTQMIPGDRPGDFNQAMMDLGATICRKQKPNCALCPLQTRCLAFANNCIETCPPQKPRRASVATELFGLIFWQRETDTFAVVNRKSGFLANTLGFPLIHAERLPETQSFLASIPNFEAIVLPDKFAHTITHHRISGKVLVVPIDKNLPSEALAPILQKLGLSQSLYWRDRLDMNAKLATALDKKAFQLFQRYSELHSYQQLELDL
jgi:A/G-specific adenine glycosylase